MEHRKTSILSIEVLMGIIIHNIILYFIVMIATREKSKWKYLICQNAWFLNEKAIFIVTHWYSHGL